MSTLKEDGTVSQDDEKDSFRWLEVIESVKSPHVWFLAVVLFFNGTSEQPPANLGSLSTLFRRDSVRFGLVSFANQCFNIGRFHSPCIVSNQRSCLTLVTRGIELSS